MNGPQVAAMVEYLKAFDPYMQTDEPQVVAWTRALLPSIDYNWALKFWATYYSVARDQRPQAYILNDGWKAYLASREIEGNDRGRSCGRSECRCTHTSCDHGWVPSRSLDDAVAPCAICKGETAEVLATLPEPGHRQPWEMSAVSEHYRRKKAVGA